MTEKTDAWMPLWIGAYLADTQHLTRDEHGGYLLLLMAYWRARSALPDDDKRLAAIAKASPAEWKRLRPTLAEFFTVDKGVWWHKRVEAEIAGADKRKAGAVSKAQAAAEARWKDHSKDAPSIAPSNAPSTPQAMPEECPTPSPTPSLRSGESRKRSAAPKFVRPGDVSEQVWADWVDLRLKKRTTVSATAIAEARAEAAKAGLTLERFLAVWCHRGSQGLQAEWLRPDERNGGETTYQRSMRERAEEIHPAIARKAPGLTPNPMEVLDATIAARIAG